MQNLMGSIRLFCAVMASTFAVAVTGTLAVMALPQITVSQKGRSFEPAAITIARGDTVVIVNDDADLLHHIYIESPNFNFDSGDQRPGNRTNVTFPASGTFNVLCAIHPKMKLVVKVK